MAKKLKQPYEVFRAYDYSIEDKLNGNDIVDFKWISEGTTWAVSEKQAINNVRHREDGDYSSQYDQIWKAEQIAEYSKEFIRKYRR